MGSYDLYNKRLNLHGTVPRDRLVSKYKDRLLKYDDNVAVDVKINNIDSRLIVISTENTNIKKITSLPNQSFAAGDIVSFKGGQWLITQSDIDDEIYIDGRMMLCPNTLKFQSPTLSILSYPYYVESNNSSLDEGKFTTTSDTRKRIKLPFDENTRLFHNDMRFLGETFGGVPQCWKIIDLDAESEKGLLTVVLEKDMYNAEIDNIELGVANYIEPKEVPTQISKITYDGLPEIKIGSEKTFRLAFYDADGIETPVTGVWTLTVPTGYVDFVTSEQTDSTIKIKLKFNSDMIGTTLNLKAVCYSNDTELNIKVVGLL